MDTVKPPQNSQKSLPKIKGTFYLLEITLGVALLLATLFTAWTPYESSGTNLTPQSFTALLNPTPLPKFDITPTVSSAIRVGIVAGHWGNDSGSVCPDGLTETEINQRVAALVQKYLIDQGIQVDILQEFDYRLNGYKANALVSIHADSCEYINDLATGFKVAAALATKRPERSARLTACIRNRYSNATGLSLHSTSVTNDMTNYHAFEEIDTETPAAIIETGFLNLDRQILEKHPELPAKGISDGIMCYLRNEDIALSTSTPNTTPIATPSVTPSTTP